MEIAAKLSSKGQLTVPAIVSFDKSIDRVTTIQPVEP